LRMRRCAGDREHEQRDGASETAAVHHGPSIVAVDALGASVAYVTASACAGALGAKE